MNKSNINIVCNNDHEWYEFRKNNRPNFTFDPKSYPVKITENEIGVNFNYEIDKK